MSVNSSTDLLAGLTAAQRQAAAHVDGPMLVLAGPGSGKTRVITHRVAYLIQQGIRPYNILAITFTNKAAEEMRERLGRMNIPRGCTMCTFHSLAARLLREFHEKAGLPQSFTIYDDADQKTAVRDAVKDCDLDTGNYVPGKVLNRISNYKNDLIGPEEVLGQAADFLSKAVGRIYQAYQKRLTKNGAVDFDDLLMKLALLIRDDSSLRDFLNHRFQYVLVDEYQDTNHCQYQIARGLALNHGNLFVTGDPDQSIYAWRGADIANILAFEQDYPDAKVVRLEENFRSTPEVLALADEIIQQNSQRKEKKLFTSRSSGSKPELYQYYDEREEARGLVDWIQQQHKAGRAFRDIAVFYRVNSLSRVLEESLIRSQVPYQVVRGVEFFKRKEIKDMLAYLKFLSNENDQVSLRRIINQPARGIGNTTVTRLVDQSNMTGISIWETLKSVDSISAVKSAASGKVHKFVDMMVEFSKLPDGSISDLMRVVYEKSGLEKLYKADPTSDPCDNIEELINSASEYDENCENPSLDDYLQQIALLSDSDAYNDQSGAVSLMTLHAAKGLEFPAVRIVAVEESLLPHVRSIDTEKGIEEERRLLFVGITRAQNELSLSYAQNRTMHGMSMATIRSQFLRNLKSLSVAGWDDAKSKDDRDWMDQDTDPGYDYSESQEAKDPTGGLTKGQMVRHPKFGLGKIQEITPSGNDCRVVVTFNTAGRKTLLLQYAKLEKLDFPA